MSRHEAVTVSEFGRTADFIQGRLEAGQSNYARKPARAGKYRMTGTVATFPAREHATSLGALRLELEARRAAPCSAVAVSADAGYRDSATSALVVALRERQNPNHKIQRLLWHFTSAP